MFAPIKKKQKKNMLMQNSEEEDGLNKVVKEDDLIVHREIKNEIQFLENE